MSEKETEIEQISKEENSLEPKRIKKNIVKNNKTAVQLGIGDSTLRKWCIELEENGYNFIKGSKRTREFTDSDLAALMYFKYLTRAKNYTMKQAAISVKERYSKEGENGHDKTESISSDFEEMIKDLLEHAKRQEEFNKSLINRLEQQDKCMKEILERLNSVSHNDKNQSN